MNWLTISSPMLGKLNADQAAEKVRALAGGQTLGACFRDGLHWSRPVRWFPLGDGEADRPPFNAPPLAEWLAHPCSPDSMMSAGMAELGKGNWKRGWKLYQWRLLTTQYTGHWWKPFPMPAWDGSPLNGRRLLVHTEQGAGDNFMFCRYLPFIEGDTTFWCGGDMAGLMRSLKWGGLIETCVDYSKFDVHAPLASLPLLLGRYEPEAAGAYLSVPSHRAARWRKVAGKGAVGLCWAGSSTHAQDATRSMRAGDLIDMAPEGVQLWSLRKGDAAGLFTADLKDWAETAAIISGLDQVISVDTGVAHLAGALGVSVKLIVNDPVEWRWTGGCRWYDSLTVTNNEMETKGPSRCAPSHPAESANPAS